MTFICLVRHGETDWNAVRRIQGRTDIPLNEIGTMQAKDCKRYLNDFQWDVIVSSPLTRAKQTAEIINEEMNIPLIVMEQFNERNYGSIEGITIEERARLDPNFYCPDQESIDYVKKRVLDGINQLHQLYPCKNVIVVAHGGVINALLSVLSHGIVGTGKTGLSNGCFSNIYFDGDGWKIKNYNQVTHLSTFISK